MDYVALFIYLGALAILIPWTIRRTRHDQAALSRLVRAKPLLTENEREFFGRLRRAVPDFAVFPQVAMAALIQPAVRERTPAAFAIWKLFGNKICDFVICRPDCSVICVVELDDRTHQKDKDERRDAVLGRAGITTLRYDSRHKPDIEALKNDITTLAAQPCSPIEASMM